MLLQSNNLSPLINKIAVILVAGFMLSVFGSEADAQLRENVPTASDYTGDILRDRDEYNSRLGLSNLVEQFNMSHSYSMSFSSIGGNYQNLNAYTNTMYFKFNNKLDARVDLSLLHSPFGSSMPYNNLSSNGALGAQLVVGNAELRYQINDNTTVYFQFQQGPSGYSPYNTGYHSPFGYGYQSTLRGYGTGFDNNPF